MVVEPVVFETTVTEPDTPFEDGVVVAEETFATEQDGVAQSEFAAVDAQFEVPESAHTGWGDEDEGSVDAGSGDEGGWGDEDAWSGPDPARLSAPYDELLERPVQADDFQSTADPMPWGGQPPTAFGHTMASPTQSSWDRGGSVTDGDYYDIGEPRPVDPKAPAVRQGPRWYRREINNFGWLLGLVPMFLLGGTAFVVLSVADNSISGLIGLFLGTTAAPGLLVAGAPFGSSSAYPVASVASIPLWLVLGWIAARRTTRTALPTWKHYFGQLAWLTLAVAIGCGAAIVLATTLLDRPLL